MYDAEYIRELTAARKANEVARALIADHERTIMAQRAELEKLQIIFRDRNRVMADAAVLRAATERLHAECSAYRAERDALLSELAALRAEREVR